jgi:hypothetical protein
MALPEIIILPIRKIIKLPKIYLNNITHPESLNLKTPIINKIIIILITIIIPGKEVMPL